MADQSTEKPEVAAPVSPPTAQENAAGDAKTNESELAGKQDGDAQTAKEESKNEAEPEIAEKKESANEDATEKSEQDAKTSADVEMKDAPEDGAGEEAAAADTSVAETPSAKNKARRKSTGGESKTKTLNKKGSKARLTHIDAKPGDHFLVKLKGFPAWPAIVCDESMLPVALINSRPVAAARPDGTYTEAYADGGKRVNDRSFPVMYLSTNEFGWVSNTALSELSSEKAKDTITDKMRKDLRAAFDLAVEHHSLEYYKDILKKFEEDLAEAAAAAATPKKSKKGKSKADDAEDMDVDDADDGAKPKSKKRKAEDDVAQTPQRPDSIKKPKIKLNTSSTPKTANGTATPKPKTESAAKTKSKPKKAKEGADKKSEAAKEVKMTPEERHARKEKEVLYLRHKLQRGLLTRDQQPQESEMKQMSDFIAMLENFADLEVSIIRATKINKVLKAILKLDSIPREEEFRFKERSQGLLDKWNKLMAGDVAPSNSGAPNGVNGATESHGEKNAETNGVKGAVEQAKDEVEDSAEGGAEKSEKETPTAGETKLSDAAEETEKQESTAEVAYIFDPDEDEARHERPQKRRRVSKQAQRTAADSEPPELFVPLLSGAEQERFTQLRQTLFSSNWVMIEQRLNSILRNANSTTLNEVSTFVNNAEAESLDRIPSAFIITGPNIASQDLLFTQLSEKLQSTSETTPSKFVRLRSPDASTLKATLKKIIRDATTKAVEYTEDDDDDLPMEFEQPGRRYLDYDLEALYAYSKMNGYKHIFVALEDSEGFDSGLLSELIQLLGSWRQRIPFTLLFGIATSVDLLQARLLKSACRIIYGAQFDVVQSGTLLETIMEKAVMSSSVPLQLGKPLLQSMLDRQQSEVVGIQGFISSLKYAYMSHFFANSLSVLPFIETEIDGALQPEHLQAIRNLTSFRGHVEGLVAIGTVEALQRARSLLEDDAVLTAELKEKDHQREEWNGNFLRSLLIIASTETSARTLSKEYISLLGEGISLAEMPHVLGNIRKLDASALATMLHRVVGLLGQGDEDFDLGPSLNSEDVRLYELLGEQLQKLEELITSTSDKGISLRSKYNGQSKVMRTTVIAQKVQLSQDSASYRDEDKLFSDIVDNVTQLITSIAPVPPASSILFSECWVYDSKSPLRDVFVPRPQSVFERSFSHPHDYLACSCCKEADGAMPASWPSTSILYRMYLETGNLINVADLWSAFQAVVCDECKDDRQALVMFYKGLSELRSLGFVKPTKKKADHIAKLKWL
ncbi:Origin recognition complex subunit 3 [Paramyrothecium foliicola]|nr:Origin recognition complex subunit 3 [Paramyrothecium foliicola]